MQTACYYFTFCRELLQTRLSFEFSENLTYDPIVSGARVDSTSKVCSSAMLVYRFVRIEKCYLRVEPNFITSIRNFIQIGPAVLELNNADRHGSACTLLFQAHRARNAQQMNKSMEQGP
jgi:hypothetical protein